MTQFCRTCGYIDREQCGSVECDRLDMPEHEAKRRQEAGEFWCARNPGSVGDGYVDPRAAKPDPFDKIERFDPSAPPAPTTRKVLGTPDTHDLTLENDLAQWELIQADDMLREQYGPEKVPIFRTGIKATIHTLERAIGEREALLDCLENLVLHPTDEVAKALAVDLLAGHGRGEGINGA